MTLATRCTACGTVFRVVEDQLRVSAGWVRCGRCQTVFNAVEQLVDVGPDAPPSPVAPGTSSISRDRVLDTLGRVAGRDGPTAPARSGGPGEPGGDAAGPQVARAGVSTDEAREIDTARAAEVAARIDEPDDERHVDPAAAAVALPPSRETRDTPGPAGDERPPGVAAPDPERAAGGGSAGPAPLPDFVRRADRAARWHTPGMRAWLGLLAVLASALLAAQAAWMHHDLVAARWPASAPVLASLCAIAGCTLEPPRRIDALAVIGSSLVRDAAPGSYRLSVTLGNRDRIAVRLPAFDLVLSDAQGRLLVRRVLQPGELGAQGDRIGAGAELSLEALLRAGDEPVVGYAVEIFYP